MLRIINSVDTLREGPAVSQKMIETLINAIVHEYVLHLVLMKRKHILPNELMQSNGISIFTSERIIELAAKIEMQTDSKCIFTCTDRSSCSCSDNARE